jgi:hypothetical protein
MEDLSRDVRVDAPSCHDPFLFFFFFCHDSNVLGWFHSLANSMSYSTRQMESWMQWMAESAEEDENLIIRTNGQWLGRNGWMHCWTMAKEDVKKLKWVVWKWDGCAGLWQEIGKEMSKWRAVAFLPVFILRKEEENRE